MAMDLAQLIAPEHTALITAELQRAVVGDLSPLPELAQATQGEVLSNIASLVCAARVTNLPVIHCTAARRADGKGASNNTRLFRRMARSGSSLQPGSAAYEIVPELDVQDSDIVLSRLHGLSPFHGTELDFILRNLGVRTVVATGVSVNVAIQNLTFDAVNAGYQVVLPRDGVAGFPPEYVEAVFRHTLTAVSTPTTTAEILERWADER
jgi:nicotinamidase-related amidase